MKKYFKNRIPNRKHFHNHPHLKFLGNLLHNDNLWHFSRRSVPGAVAIGLFCAFIPVPFQMLLAAPLAIYFNKNLPISVVMVWISNPVTIPPIFYFCYLVGAKMIGVNAKMIDFHFTYEWLSQQLGVILLPFLLGCFLMGAMSATIGYYSTIFAWRLHIWQHIKERKLRKNKLKDPNP